MRKPSTVTPPSRPSAEIISLPAFKAERERQANEANEELLFMWITMNDVRLLSVVNTQGPEAAARKLMQLAGKPWPEPGAKQCKVKAPVLRVRPVATATSAD